MNLEEAVSKHAEWKTKFRNAIAKKEQVDATCISSDNCCELGKWLYGEGKQLFGTLASHRECLQRHTEFHKEAGKIAQTINAFRYQEAENLLAAGTGYANASSAVSVSLLKLKKEAGL